MVLVSGFCFTVKFHIGFLWYVIFTETVDYDVYMDISTFVMTIGMSADSVSYTHLAGEALLAACAGLKTVSTGGKVGEYHGFRLSATFNAFTHTFELTVKGKCSYKLEIGKDPAGNIQRIHNTFFSIERKLTESEQKLETVQQQLATAQEEVKKPFPKEAELNEKMERLSELNSLLNMDEKGNEDVYKRQIQSRQKNCYRRWMQHWQFCH